MAFCATHWSIEMIKLRFQKQEEDILKHTNDKLCQMFTLHYHVEEDILKLTIAKCHLCTM